MVAEPTGTALHRRLRTGLGTFLAVEAAAQSPEQAEAAIAAAFEAMAAVERRMHPTRDGSDLASINAAAARLPVSDSSSDPYPPCPSPAIPVHPSTWELLKLAKRLNELSDGIFDPCLPCRPGVLADVELLRQREVRCRAPVMLDFGGFAKGYAVDQAIEALQHHDCLAGLVNAGGDLRAFGPHPQTILLRGPAGHHHSVVISNTAIAATDTGDSHRPPEHAGYYLRLQTAPDPDAVRHSIDRRSTLHNKKEDRSERRTAVVFAGQATLADALTKCALLCTAQQLNRVIHGLRSSPARQIGATPLSTDTETIHVYYLSHQA